MRHALYQLGVKAIIIDSDHNILLLQTPSYWDIPGGRIHEQEALVVALHREVFEEIGNDSLKNVRHAGMCLTDIMIPIADESHAGLIYVIYTATLDTYAITLSEEHIGHAWVTRDEAAERLQATFPPSFITLLKNLDL
jgi:ADP-ribose pyrophosphatase YjhB (NUDIX family)